MIKIFLSRVPALKPAELKALKKCDPRNMLKPRGKWTLVDIYIPLRKMAE